MAQNKSKIESLKKIKSAGEAESKSKIPSKKAESPSKAKSLITPNIAWALVLFGGFIECFWVSGLKHADTFPLYIFTGVGILISFCCMMLATKALEVSVCYAVFVGIGTVGVVVSEMLVFGEAFSWVKLSLIALLVLSVIGLKFASRENDDKTVDVLSENLGLDDIEDLGGAR